MLRGPLGAGAPGRRHRPRRRAARNDRSVDRGEPEGWIKDLQQACRADQCHLLLHVLRRWLAAAGAARRQLDILRRDLLKIGGRVDPWAARVRLRLASGHPDQVRCALLAARVAHE